MMPDHVHLLVRISSKMSVSSFMGDFVYFPYQLELHSMLYTEKRLG